jgi:hypothetical protein
METPKPLLKNLGAKLRQMMAEDWRGEEERNTLGMAGYWLEKLAEDAPRKCDQCGNINCQVSDEHDESEKPCDECEGTGYVCAALPNNRIGPPELCPLCSMHDAEIDHPVNHKRP